MSDSRDIIQARLLSNISDEYNKSEGEFMYDAEKPLSIELEGAYITLSKLADKPFADTAEGKDLDKIVNKFGVYRKLTTQSSGIVTITGIAGATIPKDELVSSDNLTFKILETSTIPISGIANINVKCTSYGSIGNVPIGAIKYFPKTLAGLQTVTNTSAFTNGYDEEDNDSLKERYYTKIQSPVTSGNKNQYKEWALSITGIGGVRVLSLWNGNGTVKVVCIDSNKRAVNSESISTVQNYIDPNQNGDGSGVAPLGATCTVVSATEKNIDITVSITINSALTSQAEALTAIENVITDYLKSIAFKQDYLSYPKVGSLILSINGIIDYTDLLINNGVSNVTIEDTEVAVLRGVTLG